MKNFSITVKSGAAGVTGILLFMCISCSKMPKPDFSYAPSDNAEAGMTIQFMNKTTGASSYFWDFGDGTTSGSENPEHVYINAGTYGVKLTATSDAGEKSVIKSVVITEPTVIGFIVMDYTGAYLLPYATVWVYDNKADWDVAADPQFEAQANENGIAVLINMEPVEYYYIVILEDVGGFWGYAGYISPIDQNKTKEVKVYCDWYDYGLKGTFPNNFFRQLMDQ